MIQGVGIDLCEAQRMEKCLQRQAFCDHVFAPAEQELLGGLYSEIAHETAAPTFAAKEAFLKAAGTGAGRFCPDGPGPAAGAERRALFCAGGAAAAWAEQRGLTVHVSLTHEKGLAEAIVLLESRRPKGE